MSRYLIKHFLRVCLSGCSWRRLAFDSVKETILPTNIPSTEDLNTTKRLTKGEFSLSLLELRHPSSSLRYKNSWFLNFVFRPGLTISVLDPNTFELRLNDTTGFSDFARACRRQIMGLPSFHKCINQQFPK